MIYKPREDSFLLAKAVAPRVKGKSFLDMGAGSGIQSETALTNGARTVHAVDIDKQVIAHLKSKKIDATHSDLFTRVKGKFGLVAFNPPYLPKDEREDIESARVTSGGVHGDEITLRFLKGLKKHLAPRGAGLLVLSSLTPRSRIQRLLKKEGLTRRTVARQNLFMEKLEVWELKRKPQ